MRRQLFLMHHDKDIIDAPLSIAFELDKPLVAISCSQEYRVVGRAVARFSLNGVVGALCHQSRAPPTTLTIVARLKTVAPFFLPTSRWLKATTGGKPGAARQVDAT